MWKVSNNDIQMVEGDFGIELPISVSGTTLTASDELRLTFKRGAETILEKEYSNIENNTISLSLTEQESALFPVGLYVYSLDWYQDGVFVCNIVPLAVFKVVGKA